MVTPDERAELLQAHIDATWKDIAYRWDIEPREFFEKEAPANGFKWPLAMAMHYIWKRDPKVAELEAQNATLEARAIAAEQMLASLHEGLADGMAALATALAKRGVYSEGRVWPVETEVKS